jgi:hypothetical protein
VVAFVGISYWDQTVVAWYGLLAAICAATVSRPKTKKAGVEPLASEEPTQESGEWEDEPVLAESSGLLRDAI